MICEPKPGTSALCVGAALEGPEALEQSCGGTRRLCVYSSVSTQLKQYLQTLEGATLILIW